MATQTAGLTEKEFKEIQEDSLQLKNYLMALLKGELDKEAEQLTAVLKPVYHAVQSKEGVGKCLEDAARFLKSSTQRLKGASKMKLENQAKIQASIVKECVAAESISKRWERLARTAQH